MPKTESMHAARFPDFFIIGAPKCGTTSLASWLSEHPAVFMCRPKEPHFFSSDIRSLGAIGGMEEYLGLFAAAEKKHIAVGEASTTYLRSQLAVPRILEKVPHARFIVCLRKPSEMVASVHAQLFRGGRESEKDLAAAWASQARQRGQKGDIELRGPQYADICRLGAQVERLLSYVPATRVAFVFLDDLARAPRETYLQVLAFLGLPGDDRQMFGTENGRVLPRSWALNRALLAATMLKNRLGIRQSFGLGSALAKLSVRRTDPAERIMSQSLRREIATYFHGDIDLLGRLVGRDLSNWQE